MKIHTPSFQNGEHLINLLPIKKTSLGLVRVSLFKRIGAVVFNFLSGSRPYRVRSIQDAIKEKDIQILNQSENSSFICILKPESLQKYSSPLIITRGDLKRESSETNFYRADLKTVKLPPQILFSCDQVGSAGSEGLLYSGTNRFWIRESMSDWFEQGESIHSKYIYSVRPPEKIRVGGLTLSVTRPGGTGYYHFIHECLPKISHLLKHFPEYDHFLVSSSKGSKQFIDRWLDAAGVPESKRVYADGMSHFLFDHLVFMNEWIPQYQPHQDSVKAVLDLLPQNIDLNKNRWILASRNDMDKRTLSWEDDLLNRFPKLEQIFFSKLTPQETIDLMGQTSLFIGMHGAAFSNTIWLRRGATVIELVPGEFEPLYYRLSSVCGLNHVIANTSERDIIYDYLDK